MIRHVRFILPLHMIGRAAPTYLRTRLVAKLVKRNYGKHEQQQQAAMDDWEDEGGSVAPTDVTEP